ncbi:hypothetical protein D5086_033388, partial [Populus alba]
QNKDSTGELIRKIEEAVSGTLSNSRSSRIASRLRSITGLKYHIQTHLDQLEASRQTLLDRILEIDQTMANPKEEDIERVRHCRICQAIDDGPTCVHCEWEGIISGQTKPSFIYQMFNSGDSSWPSVNGHGCQTEWLFLCELAYESYSSIYGCIFFKTLIT